MATKLTMTKAALLKKLQVAQAKARTDAKVRHQKELATYKEHVKKVAAMLRSAAEKLANTGELDDSDVSFYSVRRPDEADTNVTEFDAAIEFLNSVENDTIEFDIAREKDPFGLLHLFDIACGGKRRSRFGRY